MGPCSLLLLADSLAQRASCASRPCCPPPSCLAGSPSGTAVPWMVSAGHGGMPPGGAAGFAHYQSAPQAAAFQRMAGGGAVPQASELL